MADRAFIIPLRNDLDGMSMQVTDLWPSDSQRNYIYDPPAQAGYLKYSFDTPGASVAEGDAFVSGSLNTSPLTAQADDDTTGGGDDVQATVVTQFGLYAYIQDRVQPGGAALATEDPASAAEAVTLGDAIIALVQAGSPLTLASINTALAGAIADTELVSSGTSRSFGSVEEVLRILQGEAYRLPAFTILGTEAAGTDEFLALAAREALVAAQDVVANGGTTFVASGGFFAAGETGHRDIRPIALSGSVRISAGEGVLAGFADAQFQYLNPAFAYTAAATTVIRPRARTIDGTAIPETGIAPVVAVYDNLGNLIS